MGKTTCQACKKKCSGEVLRVQEKYFHINCFKCKVCNASLAQGGFFSKDADYYCVADYQRLFGTRCASCGDFVEGEVVTALGNTYHQKCFTCARCRQPFPAGERVTFTGQECLCSKCLQIPVRDAQSPTQPASPTSIATGAKCSGCSEELKEGQALIALDKQWHIWCFKCTSCSALLHGEYMGKDGLPYCEKDYQRQFGVKCAYCQRYIAGKVLQAGDNHHFHPTCARCSKCGDPFGDGEEMYVQGTAIWHPRCGPGPNANGSLLNGSTHEKEHNNKEFDRMSSSAASETQFSLRSHTPSINGSPSPYNSLHRKYSSGNRTLSPGLILRDYPHGKASPFEDISRIYTYSYLAAEPTQGYLKRPIDPYDKPPKSPHFHRPMSAPASGRRGNTLPFNWRSSSKPGMKALLDSIERETPRPRSPHMNNEEPIELAHYPNAGKPKPEEKSRIERDDFPAPPYPYTDPERRRRWSETYRAVSGSDGEGDEDDAEKHGDVVDHVNDPKLAKEEEELSKIATGIGKVFLQNVKEREKIRQWKAANVDPRNASRTPSASKEPPLKLRYDSAVNASPSRVLDHPKPFDEDELVDPNASFRSSVGRSVGTIPSYNVVPNSRNTPRPGYTLPLKASTLPNEMRHVPPDYNGEYSFSGLGDKTHSTEFGSKQSDISVTSLSEADRRALGTDLRSSATYSSNLGSSSVRRSAYPVTGSGIPAGVSSSIPFQSHHHLRRSLPNMSHSMYQIHLAHTSTEPPKIYPAHLLFTTNYRLPADVDRCHLERHLSDVDFEDIFHMSRTDFYRVPEWRRNDIKKRVKLF